MQRFIAILLLVVCVFSLGGCATVFSGNTSKVTINSDPGEATVKIDGVERGKTPLTLSLSKKDSYVVEISKEGYKSEIANISNRIDGGWVALDILTGFTPALVDLITGSWYSLNPSTIAVTLKK